MENQYEVSFDVKDISKIIISKESRAYGYLWMPSMDVMKYTIFGKKKTGRYTQAGWKETSDIRAVEAYTNEQMREKGYIVYESENKEGGVVYTKTRAEVRLKHDDSVYQKFDTFDEARKWVDKLIDMTGGTFETVIQ